MSLLHISELVHFLALKEHDLHDLLRHLVLRTLAQLNCSSALIFEMAGDNHVRTVARFGIVGDKIKQHKTTDRLDQHHPLFDCIKNRKRIWVNFAPEWPSEYPFLTKIPYKSKQKSFICIPIERHGTPVAALGIYFSVNIHPDIEVESFLKVVGNVIALFAYRATDTHPEYSQSKNKRSFTKEDPDGQSLTERQRVIIRMISEGRTNLVICRLLGFSESTIRQETIKIFKKLGCLGRKQAAEIYREKLIGSPDFQN